MDEPATADNSRWQAGILSVVAGYADTLGFLTFHAFAGLMTGNTVLLGIAAVEARWVEALRSASIIAAFLTGIAVAAALRRLGVFLGALLVFEAAMIIAAAFLPSVFAAPALAFAMGLQNAAANHFAGTTLNTVFLTGDLQKLVTEIVAWIAGWGARTGTRTTSGVLVVVYAGYLAGVLLGAAAHAVAMRPLLLALVPLACALVGERAGARRPL